MRSAFDVEFAQAASAAIPAQRAYGRMPCQRAQHGRVGEVALPAADRQFFGEVTEQGVGETEVAFGVFEIDRVDLVRHGRGADFAGLERLLEIAERDVAPDVAADRSGSCWRGARHRSTRRHHRAVRSAWCRVVVQTQGLTKRCENAAPVDFRIRDRMRVVVADRAVDFAGTSTAANCLRWRSRRATTLANSLPSVLGDAVWPCVRDSIGRFGIRVRQLAQRGDDLVEPRQQHTRRVHRAASAHRKDC
jgi:hypothetical protein